MAWNPSPQVADCREIARKWGGQEQVIIIALDGNGQMRMATYGKDRQLCTVAHTLGDVAFDAITKYIEQFDEQVLANTAVSGAAPAAGARTLDGLVGGKVGEKP